MWYSRYSTGLVDIDMQHANIDMLLTLYSGDSKPEDEGLWLNQILCAIQNHFEFEELRLGDSFPSDHKEVHSDLIKAIAAHINDLRTGLLGKSQFVNMMREFLVSHIQEYDMKLAQYVMES